MQISMFRYFLAVCEERSFVRAARRCGISQPSISDAIRRFEEELGGSLFIRAVPPDHETLPTALGLAIKPHLEEALANVERVKETAARLTATSPFSQLQQ